MQLQPHHVRCLPHLRYADQRLLPSLSLPLLLLMLPPPSITAIVRASSSKLRCCYS